MKVLQNVNNELITDLQYFNQINAAKITPALMKNKPKLGGAGGGEGIVRNSNIEKS